MLQPVKDFLAWVGRGIAHVRGLFPFTQEGRATLVYLLFAGAAPICTALVWWSTKRAMDANQWGMAEGLANKIAWGLMIITSALACYISIRAIRLGKDGFSVERADNAVTPPTVTTTTTTTVEPTGPDKPE